MAITAAVTVDGLISSENWQASYAWVRDQLQWAGQFDEIQMTINSYGGNIAEAFAMFDLVRSYNKPVKTIAIGQCMSAATVLFLAGSSRLIHPNTDFMTHRVRGGVEGETEEVSEYADWLEAYNQQIADLYVATTGQTADIVATYLQKGVDKHFSSEEALAAGFATAIVKPAQACGYALPPTATNKPVTAPNSPVQKQDLSMIFKTQMERLAKSALNMLSGAPAKNEAVKLSDGTSVDIASNGTIAEGDAVTIGGATAPDGPYTLEDGTVITVKSGLIDTIDTTNATNATESADPQNSGKTGATTEPETVVVPKAEYDQLVANAALAAQIPAINARMDRMVKAMGMKESGDVPTGTSGQTVQNVTNVRAGEQQAPAEKSAAEKLREARSKNTK